VGVVGEARTVSLVTPAEPEIYVSHRQKQASANAVIFVRSSGPAGLPLETVRQIMAEADPTRHMD
jgi:hypothetical protein